MTLNIYLAAAFARKAEIAHDASLLRRAGLGIASTWHDAPHDLTPEAELTYPQRARLAERDRDDLERAAVLVLYGDAPGAYAGSGGKFVEFGYALALDLHIVIIGHRESVYGCLPEIVFCETTDAARIYLAGLTIRSNGRAA
ncbi:MAG: hypothetical protein M3440_00625 [Chloroflexota bacterium]|nr:hypothetical protein [Chloroflexota bacterium]